MTGMVTAIKENRAVVLYPDGTFAEVENKGYRIGQEVFIRKPSYKKYAAMAASLLLLCLVGISGYTLNVTAASYVYMDINPSVRLDINLFQQVIGVVPLNADAEVLLSTVDVYDADITTCMENIITACEQEKYINEDNLDIEIGVVSGQGTVDAAVYTVAEKHAESLEVNVKKVSAKEARAAKKAGVSAAKLEAVKQYTDYFGGTLEENMEKLEELSARKIQVEIERAKEEAIREEKAAQREKQRAEEAAQREAEVAERERQRAEEAAKRAEEAAQRAEEAAKRAEEAAQREAEKAQREAEQEDKEKETEEN